MHGIFSLTHWGENTSEYWEKSYLDGIYQVNYHISWVSFCWNDERSEGIWIIGGKKWGGYSIDLKK